MCRLCVRMFAATAIVFACGCVSQRISVVPMVNDVGVAVNTKYRYRLSCIYKGETAERVRIGGDFLDRCLPGVFGTGGIPVALRIQFTKYETPNAWLYMIGFLSCGTLPGLERKESTFDCSVELVDATDLNAQFELMIRNDLATSYTPLAFLFNNSDASIAGRRVFSNNAQGTIFGGLLYDELFNPVKLINHNPQFRQALAYAMAVKLKELEDSGKVDAMLKKHESKGQAAPKYNIVRLDKCSDGSYSFAIDVVGMAGDVESKVDAILGELAESIKEDYCDAFPDVPKSVPVVSVSNRKVEGARISGQAVVLTIVPVSLSYDANTRRGKLSVRFNKEQKAEAWKWICKNIGVLSRDKNIALVSGVIPPAAEFSITREQVKDGNVLEIEFKTE